MSQWCEHLGCHAFASWLDGEGEWCKRHAAKHRGQADRKVDEQRELDARLPLGDRLVDL